MSRLNEVQFKAATEGDGPTLVLAGAGSGKTRVIVERLVWLIQERGADPKSLLAVTFTNRAANEMKARVAERLGVQTIPLWVGTFHSFGLYVLRRDLNALGRSTNITVFDDTDQMSLMKRLIRDLPTGSAPVLPRATLQWISFYKQRLQKPDSDVPTQTKEEDTLRALWSQYHQALAQANAVDFDDLLTLTAYVLQTKDEVRRRYAERFRFVHVDEYQDTNHAQYTIVKLLCQEHKNVFVVGDEDQSIYSWRGADITNILNFEKDFPDARVCRLEQNYRSTHHILTAANAVVSNNRMRLGKNLWTEHKDGERVRLYIADTAQDEAQYIIYEINSRKLAPEGVGVLFRTNAQARLVEEAFRSAGIAYIVIGAAEFYSRKEVKDILSYLRLLVNPTDDISLQRIVNVPPRGIGGTTFERIETYAKQRGVCFLNVLRDVADDQTLPARARNAIVEFVRLIDEYADLAKKLPVIELVKSLLTRIGYREFVRQSDEKDFRSRLEVVDEFVSSCAAAEGDEQKDLLSFLQDLSLMTDVDKRERPEACASLLTCHSAKGLEFDHVFLIGLEEGLLPHATAFDTDREMEEERRLCYVAMTRARKTLSLSYSRSRQVFGESQRCLPSRFLGEIPGDCMEGFQMEAESRSQASSQHRRSFGEIRESDDGEKAQLKMGVKVRHAKFGKGIVVYVTGSGAKQKVRIRFHTGPSRDFMVAMTPLEILEGSHK